ncbi:MAG: hypothetical protein LKG48_08795 [Lachnospiraceae bacterium]|jgi:GT2 family glycosyltransferase|nr:hypothetical protein [Lachnospiraceae bacterium]MCI1334300.1 hypothetical protein [Lachnospiraceae bacterium]MCI1358480.1 hypothetical protein [Lachnospiraceae bacterium]MCI1455303.1 hypothetical protein [Lachnospiraceae bacterium]
MKYGIALIDYNSGARTVQYMHDFLKAADVMPSVIVIVDNFTENDQSFQLIRQEMQNVEPYVQDDLKRISLGYIGTVQGICTILVKAAENLGYARANNRAAAIIQSYAPDTDAILFSNSDILFDETKLTVSVFLNKLKEKPDILGLGSDVINLKGERQSPCRYLSIEDRYWRELLLWPLLKKVYKRKSEIVTDLGREQKVYRLIGAFFFVNASNFRQVGGFDEHTFLYAEELILAERAKQHGFCMYYIPGIMIHHEDGFTQKSAEKFNPGRLLKMLDSNLYYYREYLHVPGWKCGFTKLIVQAYIAKRKFVLRALKK